MNKNHIPLRSNFLVDQAKKSWNYFKQIGYPNSRQEEWRFSNPNPWILSDKFLQNSFEKIFTKDYSHLILPNSIPIIIDNNNIIIPKKLPNHIKIMKISDAIKENGVGKSIGSINDFHSSAFAAENMALFNNGIYISLNNDCDLKESIQFLHISNKDKNSRIFPRVFIKIGKNSRANFFYYEIGDDDSKHFINSVIEILVQKNAQLTWNNLQKWNLFSGHISSCNFSIKKDAKVLYNTYDFGGGFLRRNVNTYLEESNGSFEMNSLFLPDNNQHLDINSKVFHQSLHSNSNQFVKGILGGNASGVFRGLAYIENQAKKTNAKQSNHNLLLSKGAKINSIPQLEIYEDDVKCEHGATTGQIDEEAIFYLRSRGIDFKDSQKLIIKGFAHEIINKIVNKEFKSFIENEIKIKMEKMIR